MSWHAELSGGTTFSSFNSSFIMVDNATQILALLAKSFPVVCDMLGASGKSVLV